MHDGAAAHIAIGTCWAAIAMSLTPDFLESCRGQEILIVEPFFYTPHLETGLELAERLSLHNNVSYVGPDILRCVTDETFRITSRILIELSRKRKATSYLSGAVRKYTRGQLADFRNKLAVPNVEGIVDLASPDLLAMKFEHFDVGMGILSSLLSLTRDIDVQPSRYADYALALAKDAMLLYKLTEYLVEAGSIDLVVLFNGRLASVRAIRRACEATGTRYLVHERGSSKGKFALFDCATPHQPEGYRRWTDTWWTATNDPESVARAFLARRRLGGASSWYSFTGKQQRGNCPPRSGRKRVAFFTSSEDELAAIGDELRPDSPFCDQARAIRAVGAACRERGHEYVVRFHPNTPGGASAVLTAARDSSEMVFAPDSSVDTYALIDSSDLVFTQNSTVGIEAAASGKPAFYCGRNIYEHCRAVRRIVSDSDLVNAMETEGAYETQDALRYANFLATHGIDYEYYRPTGLLSGTYRGIDLNAPLSTLRNLKLRLKRGGI